MSDPPLELRAGIYHLDGRVRCPFAGVGSRGAFASNRIVVGGDAVVTVDLARNHVLVRDRRRYDELTVLADLTFLADGVTGDGRRLPFALHLKVQKLGDEVSLDFHRHLRTQDRLVDAELEVYDVDVDDGRSVTRVLDRARAMALIVHPPFKHRLIKAMMAMRARRLPPPGATPGFTMADLTMGFGLSRLGLGMMLVRAELRSLLPAGELRGLTVPALLARGGFEVKITALSDRWLPEVIKRDAYLFGLDQVPLLAPLRERGLGKGQTFGFRVAGEETEVTLDGAAAPLDGARDVARAYLEFHMLGGLLAQHAEEFMARLG
ncbi:MAG TPA: hypothetical protein VHE35_18855 [Kofleriaceae bacterium]|nr:hypothetical protein [Kofleriaceae bacterium]